MPSWYTVKLLPLYIFPRPVMMSNDESRLSLSVSACNETYALPAMVATDRRVFNSNE